MLYMPSLINNVNTWDNLQKRGKQHQNIWQMCKSHGELITHILVYGPFIKDLS